MVWVLSSAQCNRVMPNIFILWPGSPNNPGIHLDTEPGSGSGLHEPVADAGRSESLWEEHTALSLLEEGINVLRPV